MSYPNAFANQDLRAYENQATGSYPPPMIDKQRKIDAAIAHLDERIGALNKIISDFENKLAPYLRSESPSKAVSAGAAAPTLDSRVVNKLDAISMEIDNARAFLYALMERLD